jgi:hypothetical protein
LTSNETAERLRRSARTLEAWRRAGEGPGFVRIGSARDRVLYAEGEVTRYLEEGRVVTRTRLLNTSEAPDLYLTT